MNTARILTGIPLLIMIMLVAVVGLLEYVHLTTSGLWLDELSSIFFSETSESLSYLYYSRMVQDTSPPLYYILLHYWMCIFGDGEYPVEVEDSRGYSGHVYWNEVTTLPVDAGMIGFVPFDYEPKPRLEGLVHLVEFTHHTTVKCDEGDLQFYHGDEHRLYRVQTSDDGDHDY